MLHYLYALDARCAALSRVAQDVPGADDPPDGWIHVEVVGENERGFVPIDYLDPVQSAGSVKKVEEIKSNKPFGGKSIFPAAVNAPPPAPKQIKTVFPATNNAEPLTNPTSKLTGVMAAFKAGPNRSQSPPNRPQSPPNRAQSNANVPFSSTPPPASHYTPAVSQPTPLHSPITAALASSTAGNKSSMNVGTSQVGGGLSKLKSAAKSVQSMVHVSSAVSAPRVPSLAAAVDREDFDELVRRNDEYFARLLSSQVCSQIP